MTMGALQLGTRKMGRPRAHGRRRDTTGRSRGPVDAQNMDAVVKLQRMKLGATAEDAGNALWGTCLGQLHRRWQIYREDPGGISADQYNAGQSYIQAIFRYAQVMGLPLPWPPGFNTGATGAFPDEEAIQVARSRFRDLRSILLDCGASLGVGSRINAAVYRICIEDPPIGTVYPAEIENLRYGLNAIARYLR